VDVRRISVHELDIMTAARWSFNDGWPKWQHRLHGSCGEFDPFPAYPHEVALVQQTASHVQQRFAPLWDVELFVANREERGRANGYSSLHMGGHYDDNDQWVKTDPVGLIVLSGKRVPPHPAVSRYLVAHEYGHHVEWMLEHLRGSKSAHSGRVIAEYADLRGLPKPVHEGGGGRWHDSAAEIFACDFRIIVCGVEVDYWPHPGIAHPRDPSLPHDLWGWWAAHLP
jgi:hypothetical protein